MWLSNVNRSSVCRYWDESDRVTSIEDSLRRLRIVANDPLRTIARSDSMAAARPLPVIISLSNDIQKGRLYADQQIIVPKVIFR